jgi:hypothetical protein
MRKFAALLAALSLGSATTAQAAQQACLTPSEFTALSSYALPSAIAGIGARCGESLPASAFVKTDGERLAARYATRKAASWPGAKAAFIKISSVQSPEMSGVLQATPDNTLQPLADAFVQNAVVQRLPADRCVAVDRLLRLLSPLPPENTAELIALASGLAAKDGRARIGQISICSAT